MLTFIKFITCQNIIIIIIIVDVITIGIVVVVDAVRNFIEHPRIQ